MYLYTHSEPREISRNSARNAHGRLPHQLPFINALPLPVPEGVAPAADDHINRLLQSNDS